MKLLIVEDEVALLKLLQEHFTNTGFSVSSSINGLDALEKLQSSQFDIAILDLTLPKLDGLEVLEYIRRQGNKTKIIILSARSQPLDRVKGLKFGADDYLVKPFDLEELDLRVKNLISSVEKKMTREVVINGITFDFRERKISDGVRELGLTKKESDILNYLADNPGIPHTSDDIFNNVWNDDSDTLSGTVRYHISMLKKKTMREFNVDLILNIHGQGYVLAKSEEKEFNEN